MNKKTPHQITLCIDGRKRILNLLRLAWEVMIHGSAYLRFEIEAIEEGAEIAA